MNLRSEERVQKDKRMHLRIGEVGGVATVYMAHNRKIWSSSIVGALLIPYTCCQAEIVNECRS
jgi:hypothetical protein